MPCNCTFTRHLGRQASVKKTSDKLHDFLMNPKSRPDLQTPKAQRFLHALERLHDDKTDALMPWLTREWKKGRVQHPWLDRAFESHPVGRALPDHMKDALRAYHETGALPAQDIGAEIPGLYEGLAGSVPSDDRLLVDNPVMQRGTYDSTLTKGQLAHWADFLGANHPVRREMPDLMKETVPGLQGRVQAWTNAMEAEAQDRALRGGEVVHTTPDNWTVRRLTTPEELKHEGEVMGHCVGGYHHAVADGESLIYSLRDPEHHPHATVEIQPTHYEEGGTGKITNEPYGGDQGMEQNFPIPHRGTLIQIQGKSNATPLPEYQQQLKHWFQSFPEEDRPNWDRPEHEINHVGALVPDAETWDPHYGIARKGEPDVDGDGGYGAHGDYGLVTPQRAIDYDATIESLARAKTYHEHREGVTSHNEDEPQAIYQEAVRRGEIPQFAKAAEGYQQSAYNDRDDLEDQMYDAPHYPGESYDEEPERWDEAAARDPSQYVDGHDAFEEAQRAYQYHEENLDAAHVPTQIANDLYRHLNQHKFRGSEMGPHGDPGGYQNELKSGGQLVPNDQQLTVAALPKGAQYTDLGGGVWTQGEQDKYYNPNLVPPHIALPPPPQQPLAKVAAGAPDPHDLTTFPLGQYDQALQEALNNPTRLQYTYRPDLDKEDWGGYKRYHYDVTPIGAPAMHEAVKYDRLRRFGYDPELVDPDDESEAAQFRTQWRWKGHPEWRQEMYRDPETGADAGFNEEVESRPDHLYRGMSHEEFEDAKARGYFDSNRSYNLGEEGTLFSTDPTQARSYATGFSPWHRNPGYNAPSYVVEVPRPQDAFPHPSQSPDTTEIVAPNRVPFDQATRAWQFRPYATLVEDMAMRTENNGKTWDGRPYFDNYYAYRPYPIDRQVTSADLNPNIRKCPYCKGEGKVEAPQLLPDMPFLNMGTGEQGQGVWFDGAWDVCPECHGMGHTNLGRDQPYPLADSDEHMNQWGGYSQDYNVDPKSLPPLGTPKQGNSDSPVKPLYKRWVYSPATKQVVLADNTGDPIDVPYHTDLARRINEPNLVHGYAYPIDGAWRLTDWEHQPVSDPNVIAQVMGQLRAAKAPTSPQSASWDPSEDDGDWARVHHGIPG